MGCSSPRSECRRRREAFGFLGVLILLFVMMGAGFYLLGMAQHSGRSSHWFHLAQVAYSLADASVKETSRLLADHNSKSRAGKAEILSAKLLEVLEGAGEPGRAVTLFDQGDSPPPGVQEMLRLHRDFSPEVEVKVTFLTSTPLWSGSLKGLPAVPGEYRGTIRIEAVASARKSLGARVTRTVTLDRGFKVVSVLPPLVGRFSLFVRGNDLGEDELNTIPVKFNTSTGNGEASGHPITVVSGRTAPLVSGGTARLDRGVLASTLPEPDLLDKQGWIFLGNGGSKPWVLRLAHGFGAGGESPLLPGYRMAAVFKDDPGQDEQFRKRFLEAVFEGAICKADFKQGDGLKLYHHGFAEEYRAIGVPSKSLRSVAGKLDMGPGTASPLRLFGSPDKLSPTLIFGPVDRAYIRRASLALTMEAEACRIPGKQTFSLLRPKDHGPRTWKALEAAFGSAQEYEDQGTGKVVDPYVQSLNVILDTRGSGSYNPKGLLDMSPGGSLVARTSTLLPGAPAIPQAEGLADDACKWFREATLSAPSFYQGKLVDGLSAVHAALDEKLTFVTKPGALATHLLVGGVLDLPGVVLVDEDPVTLGKIGSVKSGGILLSKGPIRLTGDISRQPVAPATVREPLTLVALSGDIDIQGGVSRLECSLVALAGRVVLPAGGVEIEGSVAADRLDASSLRPGSAPRTLTFAPDLDPVHAPEESREPRIYYGGDDKVSYAGGDGN